MVGTIHRIEQNTRAYLKSERNISYLTNMDYTILIKFALLATFCCQAAGKLIMKPRDTDIKVNQSTYFNCSTDHGLRAIFWYHGTKHVYTGNAILEPYHKRFRVDQHGRNGTHIYNLVIHSVQPGDAGQYKCAEDEGVGEEYLVQLTVLEDDPICRSNRELNEVIGQNTCNIEPDEVELECSVTYHGNIPPQMEWKKVGENSSTALEVSVVNSRNHFVSTLKLKGDIALNNSSYVCETERTTQEPINCASEVIHILYALNGNSTVNTTINEEIRCYAHTSQFCDYKWRWLQDFSTESSTAVLKARKPGWHECEAECYLRNETCNLLVMRALVSGDKESSQTRNIIISVVVTVVVTLVVAAAAVIVALVCICMYCDKRDERKRTSHAAYEGLPEICGLAILGQEVFISRVRRQDIEVYDSTTFQLKRRIPVEGMKDPEHIVSCIINNCLYAVDWCYQNQDHAILRINPTNGSLIKTWNVYGTGGLLSVASDANVILNVNCQDKLHEYTADGQLIREINLGKGTGIFSSWHAVKLNGGQFVVCHGANDDPVDRVSLLSTKETTSTVERIDEVEILWTYGAEQREPIINRSMRPIYLSVNKEGLILVSDELNKKAVLLSSDLEEVEILVYEEDGIGFLRRTCFDESTGRWIMADHHRIMVCRAKSEGGDRQCYDLIIDSCSIDFAMRTE